MDDDNGKNDDNHNNFDNDNVGDADYNDDKYDYVVDDDQAMMMF